MKLVLAAVTLVLVSVPAAASHVSGERLDVRPDSGPPGASFTITGEGWVVCEDHDNRQDCRGSDVEIRLKPPNYSGNPNETPLLADIRAKADGSFDVDTAVPSGVAPGRATISAWGETDPPGLADAPTLYAEHPFTVTAPTSPTILPTAAPTPTAEPTATAESTPTFTPTQPPATQPPATPAETVRAAPTGASGGMPLGAVVAVIVAALALSGGAAALIVRRRRA